MSADIEKQVPVEDSHDTKESAVFDPDTKEQSASATEQSSLDQPAQNEAPKPVNPWMDPASFPDGGAQAWLTVAAASACFFVSWGYVRTFLWGGGGRRLMEFQ